MAIDCYGIERRPEHAELPGGPRGKLVKDVRKVLWSYLRCRPHRGDAAWRMAWEWAEACARRDALWTKRTRKWPMPTEIASQYLLLVLAEMRESRALRLPFSAAEQIPNSIKQRFGVGIGQGPALAAIGYSDSAPTNSGGTS